MSTCDPCQPNNGPWVGKENPLGPESCGTSDGGENDGSGDNCGLEGPTPTGADCPGWAIGPGECPTPPQNVEVVHTFTKGVMDVRWDNPAILAHNGKYQVVGVNIYRSDTSERGPFRRINLAPVGGTFFRDFTNNILVQNEVVDWFSGWLNRGEAANNNLWKLRTRHFPIVKRAGTAIPANSWADVQVTINGQAVEVHEVFGPTGEITLANVPGFDVATQQWVYPNLPIGPETEVAVTYNYEGNALRTDLDRKIWYRVTTVALNPASPEGYLETPLIHTEPVTFRAVEKLSYIWREAIRRNNWILEQGGERVKVLVRKTSGIPCFCRTDPRSLEYNQQPKNNCLDCYGTGFLGGYEGPYDLIITPDDAPRSVRQTPQGRYLDHTQDVWTGPSPLLTQRDFIVKQTNERYSIGPVHKPSERGNIMQQQFQIKYLDEQDIRYQVPMMSVSDLCWPEIRWRPAVVQGGAWMAEYPPQGPWPVGNQYQQTPMQTEKENIPDTREQRGRTPVWANRTY